MLRDSYKRLVLEAATRLNDLCFVWRQGVEYEPAPGRVTQHSKPNNGTVWTHGSFVARRKQQRFGWFSFLPAPRARV